MIKDDDKRCKLQCSPADRKTEGRQFSLIFKLCLLCRARPGWSSSVLENSGRAGRGCSGSSQTSLLSPLSSLSPLQQGSSATRIIIVINCEDCKHYCLPITSGLSGADRSLPPSLTWPELGIISACQSRPGCWPHLPLSCLAISFANILLFVCCILANTACLPAWLTGCYLDSPILWLGATFAIQTAPLNDLYLQDGATTFI